MKYVSPYYLAQKFGWNVEWLDQSKIIELRQKVQTETEPIFSYPNQEISIKETLDFLNNIGDPQSLQYCLWIHSVEPLEQLLHERQLTSEKPFEISNEMQYSGKLLGMQQFVGKYLKVSTLQVGKNIIDDQKFDDYGKLNDVWKFFAEQRTIEEIQNSLADHLIAFFDEQIHHNQLVELTKLTFLQGFEFVEFVNAWPFKSEKKIELLKKIKEWEPIFRGRTEEALVQSVLTNLSHIEGLKFQLNFHQPKPDEAYADLAIEQIRLKQKAEQDRNKKIGFSVLGIIGVIILVMLIARAQTMGDDQEIVGKKDKYGNVKYYLEDDRSKDDYYSDNSYEREEVDYGDMWPEEEESDDVAAYSEYDWNQQLSIIRSYVKRNKSNSIQVSSVNEFASSDDMNTVSNPFIEFFYPLHNKNGSSPHKIVNKSKYGCIVLIKSTPDCYSYYVPSNSTYEEPFNLKDGDEFVFYLGKRFVETEDLRNLNGNAAGFEYTDEVTEEQLRFSYKVVGNRDSWYDDQSIIITDQSNPNIDFRCDVKIRTYKDGRRY